MTEPSPGNLSAAVGLCAACMHSRKVVSGKGSTFWLCERSYSDPRFRRYPPLPVLRCPGFERESPPGARPA